MAWGGGGRVWEEWEVEEMAEVTRVEARMELETVAAVKEEEVMVKVEEAKAEAAAVVTLTQAADLRFSPRSRCSRC